MLALCFSKPAIKALLKMPTRMARRMRTSLDAVAASPADYRGDWKHLHGSQLWRLRVGDWRAICEVRTDERVMLVIKIAPRGDAYK